MQLIITPIIATTATIPGINTDINTTELTLIAPYSGHESGDYIACTGYDAIALVQQFALCVHQLETGGECELYVPPVSGSGIGYMLNIFKP